MAINRSFPLAGACFIHIVVKEEGEGRFSLPLPSSLSELLQSSTCEILS